MYNLLVILILLILIIILIKLTSENFCVEEDREWESYYDKSYKLDSPYKSSFKNFLNNVEENKEKNHSVLGSVQNPMSDRNHNTRILYQPGEDVYKF